MKWRDQKFIFGMHTKCFHVKWNQNSWPDNCQAACSCSQLHISCTLYSACVLCIAHVYTVVHVSKFQVNCIIHEFYDQPIDRRIHAIRIPEHPFLCVCMYLNEYDKCKRQIHFASIISLGVLFSSHGFYCWLFISICLYSSLLIVSFSSLLGLFNSNRLLFIWNEKEQSEFSPAHCSRKLIAVGWSDEYVFLVTFLL